MRAAATRPEHPPTLHVAFELGNTDWVIAMTPQIDQAPLRREVPARALKTLESELARAKAHFGLAATAPVCSCYEAGRDGFWLHRYLVSRGIANRIVDSSSIEDASRSIADGDGPRPIGSMQRSWSRCSSGQRVASRRSGAW